LYSEVVEPHATNNAVRCAVSLDSGDFRHAEVRDGSKAVALPNKPRIWSAAGIPHFEASSLPRARKTVISPTPSACKNSHGHGAKHRFANRICR